MNKPYTRTHRFQLFALLPICALFSLSTTESAEGAGKKAKIRMICPAPLEGQAECVLASKDKKGAWREREKLKLRPSFISEWMEVTPGELGVCVSKDNELVSSGSFTVQEGTVRALAILLPGAVMDQYATYVVDTGKLPFVKGKTLLINSGPVSCTVKLGGNEVESKPGEVQLVEAAAEENGMYRMLVSHADDADNVVICHDRYIPVNTEARTFLFLVPGPDAGIRAVTMADFGPDD